jgi:hypothetical protein
MFGKLFGGKAAEPKVILTAMLNLRAQPIHRGEIFEDPLDEMLKAKNLGNVCGGGTGMADNGEVSFCDVEVAVHRKDTAKTVIQFLEGLGAPKGSKLQFGGDGDDIPFGRTEGLALYLNGTDLPDNVYVSTSSNVVYDQISDLIKDCGGILSHWQGDAETALYLYGDSFATMKARIDEFVNTYPLCKQCRIVQIA